MLQDCCIFCWWKIEGSIWFTITCLKLYQFDRITWWCLVVLEFALHSVVKYALQYVNKQKYQKNYGLHECSSGPPLGGGLDENSGVP